MFSPGKNFNTSEYSLGEILTSMIFIKNDRLQDSWASASELRWGITTIFLLSDRCVYITNKGFIHRARYTMLKNKVLDKTFKLFILLNLCPWKQMNFYNVKPDSIEDGYMLPILNKISESGFKIIALKYKKWIGRGIKFYSIHSEKPFLMT